MAEDQKNEQRTDQPNEEDGNKQNREAVERPQQPNGQTNGTNDNKQNGDAEKQPEQSKGQANGTNGDKQNGDAEKQPEQPKGKVAGAKEKLTAKQQKIRDKNNPPGGHDDRPLPSARDGYTIKFTFHRAENLPVSDLGSRSSDPYVLATLTSSMPKRHKEDPDVKLRTPTMHKNTNPEWNTEWIVAGIPSSGFRLKCRLYDEDPSDHDDRLGNVTINVNHVDRNWPGIREENFPVKKRMGSKRAYLLRGCASMLSRNKHMNGHLFVSAEVLGESDKPHGRMYTVGKTAWTKHYSPMIGRIAGTKAPGSSEGHKGGDKPVEKHE